MTYARRLRHQYPQLSFGQLSELSGASVRNLKEDPAFRSLPAELAAYRDQCPQRENESNQEYARRLHREFPNLSEGQLSLLSGATVRNLKADPAFRSLPADLAAYRDQCPRREKESYQEYARRLHREFPNLSEGQLSLLSGAKASRLKADPAFRSLPAELAAYRDQCPRVEKETNAKYARRLHRQFPQLSWDQLSQLSGVTVSHLRAEPAFKTLPDELVAYRNQFPRVEKESDQEYARRLHHECPQLSWDQLSLLSGATESRLRRDPAFQALTDELAAYRDQVPRVEKESNADYAHRLHHELPSLSVGQLSLLSGATEFQLRADPVFWPLPDELAAYRDQLPRRENETRRKYALRLHDAFPNLTSGQLSQLSGAKEKGLKRVLASLFKRTAEAGGIRRVRPRLSEPSGTPIQQLVQVLNWQFAGAMALMRHRGLSLADAERSAGLPPNTLSLVSDHQGRLRPHDFQTILLEDAGADAPQVQELLAYLDREQQRGPQGAFPATPAATPQLAQLAAELEAQLAQAPERAQPQPDPAGSGAELDWGARQGRSRRAWERLADPSTPAATPGLEQYAAALEAQLAQTPERAQPQTDPAPSGAELDWGARQRRSRRAWERLADSSTPAATPGLEQYAAAPGAQSTQTPERAQPQTDPAPSGEELAWGARQVRSQRAWEGLGDPGTPAWEGLGDPGDSPQGARFDENVDDPLDFDLSAPQQEVTGPGRNAAVSAARMPTFDEEDTGPNWQHGLQVAPEWLLGRGVHDQQIVRIRDVEYRVVARPGMSNAWGEPQLFLRPHIRGG